MNKTLKGIVIWWISVLTLGWFYKYLNSGNGKITNQELIEIIDDTKYFDGLWHNAQKWGIVDSLQMMSDSTNDILIQQWQEIAEATNGKVYLISSDQTPLDKAKEIVMDLDKDSDLIIMVDVTTSMIHDGDLNNATSALLSMIEIMRKSWVRVAVYTYTDDEFKDWIHGTQVSGLNNELSPEDIIFRIKYLWSKEEELEFDAVSGIKEELDQAYDAILSKYMSWEIDSTTFSNQVNLLNSKFHKAGWGINHDPLETPFSGVDKALIQEKSFWKDGRKKVILLVWDAWSKVRPEQYIKKCVEQGITTNTYPVLLWISQK